MTKVPYISLCIPTFNRIDILKNTLDSIYSDLNGISIDDFEVIISDNEPGQTAKVLLNSYQFKNLHYHATSCEGFLNSFYALQYGKGKMLKLHNNYTQLKPGSLRYLIEEVKLNSTSQSVIFYTDGLNGNRTILNFDNFNQFMYELSYFSSWSTGFSIWREKLEKIKSSVHINNYFPQTSLLLALADSKKYVLNDLPLFSNQQIPKKGGYNIFRVFAVDFIRLIEEAYQQKKIELNTFRKIKRDLLTKYLSIRYFKTVIAKIDNFEKTDIRKNISVYYGNSSYYLMIALSLFAPLKYFAKKANAYFEK